VRRKLGYILSSATTTEALFESREEMENNVREGILVVVESGGGRILGSVTRIEVYNEFYEPGSVWAESIRRDQLPPKQVARRYMVARIQFYGCITPNGLVAVDKPPEPGAVVYEAAEEDLEPLYGYKPGTPTPEHVIEIGDLYGYSNASVPLRIDRVTMHFAVLGVTGSGKSNTTGVIIEELGNKKSIRIGGFSARTLPVIVFDANGDYLDYYEKPDLVPSFNVMRLVFPHMTTNIQQTSATLEPLLLNLNVFRESVNELAEAIYALVRGGAGEGMELQIDLLVRALNSVLDPDSAPDEVRTLARNAIRRCPYTDRGVDLNCLFGTDRGIEIFRDIIENHEAHTSTKAAVKRTVSVFYEKMKKFGLLPTGLEEGINEEFVDDITNPEEPCLAIVDFSPEGAAGVDLRLKQFVVYYLARLFLNKFIEYKTQGKQRAALMIVEEAQNYLPNQREYPLGYSVARSVLALVATQGRKFGLSLALVTQRPSFVDPVVLSMMNTFIVHRVSSGDVKFVQLATGGLPRHLASKLPVLETGLAIIIGQMSPFPYPVLAKIRRRKSHAAGSI